MKEALSLEPSRRKFLQAIAAGFTLSLLKRPLAALGLTNIHMVKSGETLTSIGNLHGVSVLDLTRANQEKITDPNLIWAGDSLQIPDKDSSETIILYQKGFQEPLPITFQGDFGVQEKRLAVETIRKTRAVLQKLGFEVENFPIGQEVRIRRSQTNLSSSPKADSLALIDLDSRGVAHEYATNFAPANSQAIVEGVAEMVAVKVLGFYVLPLDYSQYQNHNWKNELWWDQSGSYDNPHKTIWGKITLAAQAVAIIENQKPGIWAHLGTKYRGACQEIENPRMKELQEWVEGFWPRGWNEFEKHPILSLSN